MFTVSLPYTPFPRGSAAAFPDMTCAMDEASAIVYVVNYATIWRMKLSGTALLPVCFDSDSGTSPTTRDGTDASDLFAAA